VIFCPGCAVRRHFDALTVPGLDPPLVRSEYLLAYRRISQDSYPDLRGWPSVSDRGVPSATGLMAG
jgi:hypothetical protein